jgi:starch synthase
MAKLKILYVGSEIKPFLETSLISEFMHVLPKYMYENDFEPRIIVPRFGVIGIRKNKIHEIARLSGIDVAIGKKNSSIVVRSSSLQDSKLQVYFIDNEDYFSRKFIFYDQDNVFFNDNDDRIAIFCKGVIEAIKKLEWVPDVIHCHGWMSALLPLILKVEYKNDSILKNIKIVYSIYNEFFENKFNSNVIDKLFNSNINVPQINLIDFASITNYAIQYSDIVTIAEDLDAEKFDEIIQDNKLNCININLNEIYKYVDIYNKLK